MEKLKHSADLYKKLVEKNKTYGDTFSKNVNLLKEQYGFTIQDISDGTGLSQETIKSILYYENKDYKITHLAKMAEFFNLSMEELCGSSALHENTIASIEKLRILEGKYNYFLQATIDWMYQQSIEQAHVTTVPVYAPKCDPVYGSLKYDVRHIEKPLDISDVPDAIRSKILMAVKIPCGHYIPYYYPGDYLLIAKDRNVSPHETVVVIRNGHIELCTVKYVYKSNDVSKEMYSLINKEHCGNIKDCQQVLGYVATVNV